MGKWVKYKKHHNKDWEANPILKGWLTANPNASDSSSTSYCKWCRTALRAHKGDLEKHATTEKHLKQKSKMDASQLSIVKFGVSITNNAVKRQEIILASYVGTHSTIRSVDHLNDIINDFKTEHQDKIHLHRTKCAAIIKGVIAPSLLADLIADVGDSPFSLIVDESTDSSTQKVLCIIIKYYSLKKNDIVTQFLTFLNVTTTTAQDLYDAVTNYFTSIKLNLKNLIGIGTDGASNLCGSHHSLFTLLKSNFDLNNLLLVKCICHSLHLCASKASEVFSDETDFLLKETYNWFKNSTVRLHTYTEIYNLINTNTDNRFKKLTRLSATRWLSRYGALEKILTQYLELQTFFSINAPKERCHTAKLLSEAFNNIENKVILIFLKPILKQIHILNMYFQNANVDFYQAFEDVNTTIWSLARQIIRPPVINNLNNNLELLMNCMQFSQNFLRMDDCDFGYDFSQAVKAANLANDRVQEIQSKCLEFIKCLLRELIQRMPNHLNVFRQVKAFSPKIILNPALRPKFSELPLIFAKVQKLSDIETQYRNLVNVHWNEIFNDAIPDDPIVFWKKVITLKNAAGDIMFKDLSLFAFTMLSLPSSNAVVERCFSVMNIVKCKLRNKMMLDLLNSIMSLKFHFYVNRICCKTFEPTANMFSRFNSNMYNHNNINDNNDASDVDEIINICGEL